MLAYSLLILMAEDMEITLSAPAPKTGGKKDSVACLRSMDVQIEVTGNIASTRYTMIFQNNTDRDLEGTLTFPLPNGRSATYCALDINGRMREGVPVEKSEGTRVFERIQSRWVDPGLLERVEGNLFRMRVYPIRARRTRTVSIGYDEDLTLENSAMPSQPVMANTFLRYNLPVICTDSLERFSVKAVWKGGKKAHAPESENWFDFHLEGEDYVASFTEENYRPARALTFALPATDETAHVMMRSAPADIPRIMTQPPPGNCYFVATVAPKLETRPKRWADNLAIIWDVSFSASRRDIERELGILDVIFSEKKDTKIRLYFLNNKFREIVNKNADNGKFNVSNGNWDELRDTLKAAVFDGGTDFSQINLEHVAGSEILFFSDGISTLGDADFLKNAAARRPVHCVVSSARADYGAMRRIAAKTKGKFVDINALSSENIKYELRNETPLFLGVERGGAVREVYPSIAMPFYDGFSVAGISSADSAELTLLFGFDNKVEKRVKVLLDAKGAIDSGNVHKIWAQKKLAELDLDYESNRDAIMELGQRFGVVTRNVSLIMLETLDDYLRYNIIPPADLRHKYSRFKTLTRLYDEGVIGDGDYYGKNKTFNYLMSIVREGPFSDAEWQNEYRRFLALTRFYSAYVIGGDSTAFKRIITTVAGGEPKNDNEYWSDWRFYDIARYLDSDGNAIGFEYLKKWLSGGRKSDAEWQAEFRRVAALEKELREKIIGYHEFTERLYDPSVDGAERAPRWRQTIDNMKRRWYSFLSGALPPVIEYAASFFEKLPDELPSRLAHTGETGPVINIKPVKKDNDYLKELTGKAAEDLYLMLREDYAYSPTFYFDMADWFYTNGDKEAALRTLTSIAELDFENASLYRSLGYRLKEYGEYALEKFVCQKVVEWRPMDAQSYRDYALALADNGETQTALDSLYSLFERVWRSTFWPNTGSDSLLDVEDGLLIVLVTEMNRLIAQNPRLNTSMINDCMIKTVPVDIPVPVDIRVVINGNMKDTYIDLHVKDPTGEECFWLRREPTRTGGRMSGVISGSYGPEQFMLKNAIKGKYGVYVNYRGDNQFTAAGPTTVMAEIFTNYADKSEQRKVISLQLSQAKDENGRKKTYEKVLVAEFEF
jgi:tetratricopeptide (TPR) repeat protein